MKKWLFLFTIISILGCSQKVISYLDNDARFEQFESFRIVSVKLEGRKVAPESNQIFEEIKAQIINQMLVRSYEQSNITPDLTLRYELSSSSRSEQNNNNNAFNNTIGFPGYNGISSRTIHESILILELYNSNKKLVWQGSYDLKQQRKEDKTSKVIQNAIEQIFTTYPYEAGSRKINPELTITKRKKND